MPKNIKIHYWLHKYDSIMFNPCFGIAADIRNKKAFFTCSLLKFKPFGFLIVDYKDSVCDVRLPVLESDNKDNLTLYFSKDLCLDDDYSMCPPSNGLILLSNSNFYYGKK